MAISESPSTMSRAFRRELGMPLRAFRRQVRFIVVLPRPADVTPGTLRRQLRRDGGFQQLVDSSRDSGLGEGICPPFLAPRSSRPENRLARPGPSGPRRIPSLDQGSRLLGMGSGGIGSSEQRTSAGYDCFTQRACGHCNASHASSKLWKQVPAARTQGPGVGAGGGAVGAGGVSASGARGSFRSPLPHPVATKATARATRTRAPSELKVAPFRSAKHV